MFGWNACPLLPLPCTVVAAPPNHCHYSFFSNCFQNRQSKPVSIISQGEDVFVSKRLLTLLPLPPIWEHKIRSVSNKNTQKRTCTCFCMCVWACTSCTDRAAETAWLKTNWQKTFEAESGKGAHIHTTTCQERIASNFSVICQTFNKTRSALPPHFSLRDERQTWGAEEEGRRRGGKTRDREHQMSLSSLKSFNSLNLSSFSRL